MLVKPQYGDSKELIKGLIHPKMNIVIYPILFVFGSQFKIF